MDLTTLLREIALTVSDGDLLAHEVRAIHEDDDDSYEITGVKLRYNTDGKPVLVLELGLVDE